MGTAGGKRCQCDAEPRGQRLHQGVTPGIAHLERLVFPPPSIPPQLIAIENHLAGRPFRLQRVGLRRQRTQDREGYDRGAFYQPGSTVTGTRFPRLKDAAREPLDATFVGLLHRDHELLEAADGLPFGFEQDIARFDHAGERTRGLDEEARGVLGRAIRPRGSGRPGAGIARRIGGQPELTSQRHGGVVGTVADRQQRVGLRLAVRGTDERSGLVDPPDALQVHPLGVDVGGQTLLVATTGQAFPVEDSTILSHNARWPSVKEAGGFGEACSGMTAPTYLRRSRGRAPSRIAMACGRTGLAMGSGSHQSSRRAPARLIETRAAVVVREAQRPQVGPVAVGVVAVDVVDRLRGPRAARPLTHRSAASRRYAPRQLHPLVVVAPPVAGAPQPV